MFRFSLVVALVACWSALAAAHTVIVYPGWRGNNIITNGTTSLTDPSIIPGSLGITYENDTHGFPYGMQWMYPCGGMPTSTNRTKWPLKGGAVSIQPGWFPGHANALFYFNMGYGNEPLNYSHSMLPVFQITGPSNLQYDGTFCLPQVPLPAGYEPQVGDNATIQIVETAQHGAALYNCADITFAEPADVPEVTRDNCFNSTNATTRTPDIGFQLVYATTSSPAPHNVVVNMFAAVLVPLLLGAGFAVGL
ncbi:hypothetical protein P153DRAFT_139406 [Dothidotthia symphoricarpi CBS 119687]|uniref:Copper acquisition factor BIM1-like domain-containing protein n=1 Tax=Dothidotthia symphoricarpi CBS 119687 TaxID=1392245 RepID=A0A6A5ZXI8_9PLEO|nr:uncharacterized protein P153DRAFT_139406 [Dothidotthia symphoricarpi CBS 119687]KAF2124300.1 hypothetical protein P153DRAFT_139406 [Dothidotthia symphoricarpi CBS 119687]